jgi:hypothetical protein
MDFGLGTGSPVNVDQTTDDHSAHEKTQESSVLVHIFFHIGYRFS